MQVQTNGGAKFFFYFIDDYSCYTVIYRSLT
jgi:hypothetical protein